MSDLHKDAIVIDGLIISKWSRAVFEDMKSGGLTAANCTCSVWDGFKGTMENIAQWKIWFEEHDDLLTQVFTTEDIRRAKEEDKVGTVSMDKTLSSEVPSLSKSSAGSVRE